MGRGQMFLSHLGGQCSGSHRRWRKTRWQELPGAFPTAALTQQFTPICLSAGFGPATHLRSNCWAKFGPLPSLLEAALWLQPLAKAGIEVFIATSWPVKKQPRNPHPGAVLNSKGWDLGWTGRGDFRARTGCGWGRTVSKEGPGSRKGHGSTNPVGMGWSSATIPLHWGV